MQRKYYNSIDLFKLLMAFCVVAIHTCPLYDCSNAAVYRLYENVVTMAVPFFFITAGFLLAQKAKMSIFSADSIVLVQQYLHRIVRLYLIWSAVYFPLAVWFSINSGWTWQKSILLYLRNFLFIGEQYNSWPLWYLLSMIYALWLILALMHLHAKPSVVISAGVCCLVLSMSIDYLLGYENSMPQFAVLLKKALWYVFGSGRIFTGPFYMITGMSLSGAKRLKRSIPAVFLLLTGFIGRYFFPQMGDVLLALCVICLFYLVKEIKLPDSPLYLTVRKMSTVIYFIHMYVWTGYYRIVYGQKTYGMDSFLVTTTISAVIAVFYLFVQKKMQQAKA